MSSNLANIGELAAEASALLNAIRGGEVADMEAAFNQMSEQFNVDKQALIEQFNADKSTLLEYAAEQLDQRAARVDGVLDQLVGQHSQLSIHYYNGVVQNKSSLSIVADSDSTVSQWVAVPSTDASIAESMPGALTKLHTRQCVSVPAGYPDYTSDTSRTYLQFVVASKNATSADINAAISADNITLIDHGVWGTRTQVCDIPTIETGHTYKKLYVRFVNRPAAPGLSAQNIVHYGGDGVFAVEQVVNYPYIKQ